MPSNILLIMTDQHCHRALSCMGHELVETPNIDRLAREGVIFTDASTPSPICAPARGAMFSGRYPPGCGMVTNWVPFTGDEVLAPEHLAGAGYTTALVGKLHFVPHRKRYGFMHHVLNDAPYSIYADDHRYSRYVEWLKQTLFKDDPDRAWQVYDEDERAVFEGDHYKFFLGSNVVPEEYHMTAWTANESIDFIEKHDAQRPFFLFSSFFGPHQPYDVPEPWRSVVDPESIEMPEPFDAEMQGCPVFEATKKSQREKYRGQFSLEAYRRLIASYLGNVAMIDHYVGAIFETLERRGLWENTTVIFTSDHGDHTGDWGLFGKGDMYETSVRVPLIVKPAAGSGIETGRRIERPVSTIDLYGTLCELGGVDGWRDEKTECGSLLGLLRGEAADEAATDVYSIVGADADGNTTMLRRGPLKMIRLARPDGQALYELHDLRTAPRETTNVYAEPSYRTDRDAMKADLDRWWAEQKAKYPGELRLFSKRAKKANGGKK